MRATLHRVSLALLIVSIGLLPACSSQEPPATEPEPDAPAPAPAPRPAPEEPAEAGEWEAADPTPEALTPEQLNRMGVLRVIYFDYDKSEIRTDQRSTLQTNAQWLRDNRQVKILIEGHCDERGTREYNMALGERRSSATMQYLMSLGVPRDRIEVISYGEEQPVAMGEDESAWSRNRRAEFKVVSTAN